MLYAYYQQVVKELSAIDRENNNGERYKLFPFPVPRFNEWENIIVCLKGYFDGDQLDTFDRKGKTDPYRVLCPLNVNYFKEACMQSTNLKIRKIIERVNLFVFPPRFVDGKLVPYDDYHPVTLTSIMKAGDIELPPAKLQRVHDDFDYATKGNTGVQPVSFFLAGHDSSYIGILDSDPVIKAIKGVDVSHWKCKPLAIPPGWALIAMCLHCGWISPSFFTFNIHCYVDVLGRPVDWRTENAVYPMNERTNKYEYFDENIAERRPAVEQKIVRDEHDDEVPLGALAARVKDTRKRKGVEWKNRMDAMKRK